MQAVRADLRTCGTMRSSSSLSCSICMSTDVIVYLTGCLRLASFCSSLGRADERLIPGTRIAEGGDWEVAIVEAGDVGRDDLCLKAFVVRHDLGYEVIGFCGSSGAERSASFGRFHRLGNMEDVSSLIRPGLVTEIVIPLPGSARISN